MDCQEQPQNDSNCAKQHDTLTSPLNGRNVEFEVKVSDSIAEMANPEATNLTELEPLRNIESSFQSLDGLPSLDDFCANASDSVRTIYNMLGDRDDSETIFNLLNTNQTDNSGQPVEASNYSPPPTLDNSSFHPDRCEEEENRWNDINRDTGESQCTLTAIGAEKVADAPSSETTAIHTNDSTLELMETRPPPLPFHQQEPDEHQIDEAFQNVFEGFSTITNKETTAKLTNDVIENCLRHLGSCPIMVCPSCLDTFNYIPPFQIHIQTCVESPKIGQKIQRVDQGTVNHLACTLWKGVFIKELQLRSPGRTFVEYTLHMELDQLWDSNVSEVMLKVREMFMKAAVDIALRRWVSKALSNELLRPKKSNPSIKPKKKRTSESDAGAGDDEEERPMEKRNHLAASFPSAPAPPPQSKKRKRNTKPKPTAVEKETRNAVNLLVRDLLDDEAAPPVHPPALPSPPYVHHVAPETPVSNHGSPDFNGFPTPSTSTASDSVDHHQLLMEKTMFSDSGVEFTPEMECFIDIVVREGQASTIDVDLLASEAANSFSHDDGMEDDNGGGCSTSDEAGLSENEFIVGKILDRRLSFLEPRVKNDHNQMPNDEDYEYLVAWEGYGDDDNTWEPYDHLKHCTLKLQEFHERLRAKAMRGRKGKRI